jgi:hypothetical protein
MLPHFVAVIPTEYFKIRRSKPVAAIPDNARYA